MTNFEPYFNADYRRFNFVEAGASMIEVKPTGELINHGKFNWKQDEPQKPIIE